MRAPSGRIESGRLISLYLAGAAAAGAVLLLVLNVPSAALFREWITALQAGRPAEGGAAARWSIGVMITLALLLLVTGFEHRGRLDRLKGWRRVAVSLLLALIPPLMIFTRFEADGPWAILIGISFGVNLLNFAAALGLGSMLGEILRRLIYTVSAVLIISGIIITPLSAYLAWFDILKGTGTGGLIPFVFSMVTGLFTSAFGAAVYRRGYLLPTFGCIAVTALVSAIIMQNPWVAAFALAVSFISLVLLFRDSFVFAGLKEGGLFSPLTALGLALLLAAPAALLTTVQGSPLIDDYISPWIKNQVTAVMPDFPFLYSMPGYGFRMNEKRLGGRPALSERAIFRVQGPPGETLYLRTRVFDAYTGQGWGVSEGLMKQVQNEKTDYFRAQRSGDEIEIEVLIDFTNTLPHPLGLSHFRSRSDYETVFASLETGFLLQNPILKGDIIRADRQDGRVDSPNMSPYLQVTSSLPQEVRELALSLGSGLRDEPDKTLANIATYLAENNSYSLDVGYADTEVDSTWDFLFNSKTGYCTNFATAYVLLARLNGIPARYATGFLVFMPFDNGETFVTGYASHAWPEVWLEDTGWIAREATPPMNPDFMEEYFYYGEFGGGMSENTSNQLEQMLGDRSPDNDTGSASRSRSGFPSFLFPLLLGIAGALLLLMLKRPLLRMLPLHDPVARTERELRRIVRILREPGIPSPEDSGWVRWSRETIRRRKRKDAVLIQRVSKIALNGFFGPLPPGKREIKFLRSAAVRIRRG